MTKESIFLKPMSSSFRAAVKNLLITKVAELAFLSIDSEADTDVDVDWFLKEHDCASVKYYTLEDAPQACSVRVRVKCREGNKYHFEVTEVDAKGDVSIYSEHIEINQEY